MWSLFNGGADIEALKQFWTGLDWSVLTNILTSIIPAFLCITIHELCHGFVAYKLGDNTAKNAGRLTLNPIKHIDIVGLISMVFLRFGWAKPVPVNMNNFKNPKSGMAITALAGPLSNVILAALCFFIYGIIYVPALKLGTFGVFLIQTVGTTGILSCSLAVFNILPIPPMDGSKILFSFLPEEQYYKLMRYERFGMIILLVLLITNVINPLINFLAGGLISILNPLTQLGFQLVN